MTQHVNDLNDYSSDDLLRMLDLARTIKAAPEQYRDLLSGQSLALLSRRQARELASRSRSL